MERLRRWRDREGEKLRGMTLPKRIGYVFTYYKGWMLGFLVLALFAGYAADVVIQNQKETVLQGFFTNDQRDYFPAARLQGDVADHLGLDGGQRIIFDDGLYVDLHGEAVEYTAASNGKIIAYISTASLDFVVTTGEVYRHFAQDVPLLDLSQHLPADVYDRLAPYIDAVPDPAGERGSVPGAIELSQSRFLQDAGLPEGSYYLFVPYNAPHVQALCQFIQYCFPAQPPR
jgi:hypothetical protein